MHTAWTALRLFIHIYRHFLSEKKLPNLEKFCQISDDYYKLKHSEFIQRALLFARKISPIFQLNFSQLTHLSQKNEQDMEMCAKIPDEGRKLKLSCCIRKYFNLCIEFS